MKNILIIASLIMLAACSKNNDCINVQYGEAFVAQPNNTYCFSDGNELTVDSLVNSFCPCDAVCVWEGVAEAHMTWTIDGVNYSFIHYSEANRLDSIGSLPLDFTIESDNPVFAVPCDNNNPSPDITALDMTVTTN